MAGGFMTPDAAKPLSIGTACLQPQAVWKMSLRHLYGCAAEALRRWPSRSRPLLARLCRQIQDAERRLNAAAAIRLQGCLKECQGLCCRNLDLDAIFGVPDFVYILATDSSLDPFIAASLKHENPFFTMNCPFLEHGVGPCIFPPDVRPEVCITSFCRGDATLKPDIRRVKICFWKLGVLVQVRRLPYVHRLLADVF